MSKFKIITALLICIAAMPMISRAQLKPITGTVTDGKGKPISGASILISGKAQGTVSDEAGKFKLNVPENATLIVSYTGYRNQTIKWNGSTDIKIELVEDIARLDEVGSRVTSHERRSLIQRAAASCIRPWRCQASRTGGPSGISSTIRG